MPDGPFLGGTVANSGEGDHCRDGQVLQLGGLVVALQAELDGMFAVKVREGRRVVRQQEVFTSRFAAWEAERQAMLEELAALREFKAKVGFAWRCSTRRPWHRCALMRCLHCLAPRLVELGLRV
jgi:hypothetical protein